MIRRVLKTPVRRDRQEAVRAGIQRRDVLGGRASVFPKDNGNNGIPGRKDSYVCWRDEFGEMKVVGSGSGPKLGNLGVKGYQITDFDGAEDSGRGRENHNTGRDGLVIGFLASEPECGRTLGGDEVGKRQMSEASYLCRDQTGDVG